MLRYLIDPEEKDHALSVLKEIIDLPGERPHPLAKTIYELIIEPLETYIQKEFDRTGGSTHAGMTAAHEFLLAAEEIAYLLTEENCTVFESHISILEKKWDDFTLYHGFSDHLKYLPFKEAPKKERLDALGKIMEAETLRHYHKTGMFPSAKKLWELLPIGATVQEKCDDGEIYWKQANGAEKTTTFKAYQNRYTIIRKKLIKKILHIH